MKLFTATLLGLITLSSHAFTVNCSVTHAIGLNTADEETEKIIWTKKTEVSEYPIFDPSEINSRAISVVSDEYEIKIDAIPELDLNLEFHLRAMEEGDGKTFTRSDRSMYYSLGHHINGYTVNSRREALIDNAFDLNERGQQNDAYWRIDKGDDGYYLECKVEDE